MKNKRKVEKIYKDKGIITLVLLGIVLPLFLLLLFTYMDYNNDIKELYSEYKPTYIDKDNK